MLLEGFEAPAKMFSAIVGVIGFIVFIALLLTRGKYLRAWGKKYGLQRDGNRFFGEYNGSQVELVATETGRETQGKNEDLKHYLFIETCASVVGTLPDGLHIAGARYHGKVPGERITTVDKQFNEAFRVFAEDVEKAHSLLRIPGLTNVLLNLREISPDLRVADGTVYMRMSIQQATSTDPRQALDRGFTTVLKAAQILSWAAHGQSLADDELANSRPEPKKIRGPLSLPQRRAGREI